MKKSKYNYGICPNCQMKLYLEKSLKVCYCCGFIEDVELRELRENRNRLKKIANKVRK